MHGAARDVEALGSPGRFCLAELNYGSKRELSPSAAEAQPGPAARRVRILAPDDPDRPLGGDELPIAKRFLEAELLALRGQIKACREWKEV